MLHSYLQRERVSLPVPAVYDLCADVESLPRFLPGVRRVTRLSDELSVWRTTLGGRSRDVDVLRVRAEPGHRLVWRSVGPAGFRLALTFAGIGPELTEVRVRLDVEPGAPACHGRLIRLAAVAAPAS